MRRPIPPTLARTMRSATSIRWTENGHDPAALRFAWTFAQCGDPSLADTGKKGNIRCEAYGIPDGIWVDPRGILWIETDVSTSVLDAATTRISATK